MLYEYYDTADTPDLVGRCRIEAAGEDVTDRCVSASIEDPATGTGVVVCRVCDENGCFVGKYDVIFGDLRIEDGFGVDKPPASHLICPHSRP